MRVNLEDLEAEADAAFSAMNGTPDEVDESMTDTVAKMASDDDEDQPIELLADSPPEAVATDTEQAGPAHDPDGDLTTAQALERYRNAQSRMTRATQEAAELRRTQQAQTNELVQLRAELAASRATPPRQADTATAPGSSIDSVGEDYPDFKPVFSQIKEQERQLRELREDNAKSARQAEHDAHNKAVTEVHPDAFSIAATDQFSGWVDRQPPVIQKAVRNGTAADVNWVLTQYKTVSGVTTAQSKDDKLAAAKLAASPNLPRVASSQAQGNRSFTRSQIEKMTAAQYAQNEVAIDAALVAGLIY